MRVPVSTYRLRSRSSTSSRRPGGCPTSTTSVSTGYHLSPILSVRGRQPARVRRRFDRVDPGSAAARRLAALSGGPALGMGVLVDIVPNHVGIATPAENPWWWGRAAARTRLRARATFDVDWAAGDGNPGPGRRRRRRGSIRIESGPRAGGPLPRPAVPDGARHDHARGSSTTELVAGARRHRSELLALLRGQHAGRRRVEDPRCRRDPRRDPPVVHRGPRRRPAGRTTRTACGSRRRYLDDLAFDPHRRRLRAGRRSSSPARTCLRDWATAGTTATTRSAIDRVLDRPGRREAADAGDQAQRGLAPLAGATSGDNSAFFTASSTPRSAGSCARSGGSTTPCRRALEDAVAHLLAAFPVYRSYLPQGREHLDEALETARIGTSTSRSPASGRSWSRSCRTRGRRRPGGSSRPAAW